MKFYRKLPSNLKDLLILTDGWLIGSSIQSLIDGKVPTDYDVVVKGDNFCKGHLVLKEVETTINTFGGLKFIIHEMDADKKFFCYRVDFWPDDIERLLIGGKVKTAYHIKSNTFIRIE